MSFPQHWVDARLKEPLLSLELVFVGVNLDREHVAGLERHESAVKQDHFYVFFVSSLRPSLEWKGDG